MKISVPLYLLDI